MYLYSAVQRTQATSVYLDAVSRQLVPLEVEANYFLRTSRDTASTLLIIIQRSGKYQDSLNMISTGVGHSRLLAASSGRSNWTCMHSIMGRLPVNSTVIQFWMSMSNPTLEQFEKIASLWTITFVHTGQGFSNVTLFEHDPIQR